MVLAKYPKTAVFYGEGVKDILVRVRDMVHRGAKVLNHPQSGSIAPGVSPYKSLIATCDNSHGAPRTDFDSHYSARPEFDSHGAARTDFDSLRLIESALAALAAAPASPTSPMSHSSPAPPPGQTGYDERTLEDFQVLDLDLLGSALQSMSAVYDL